MGDTPTIRIPAASSPAERLIGALGLEARATAEVQDLYSRPVEAAILRVRRPERARLPDLAA
ncbi:MAG TPA: hypothetical protein VMN37_08930 [Gemmatimonadales bacterium]|nr:hypothetical protein [Gemmatimonadales bacterium]